MNRFKQWLSKTFYGAYGIDKLYFVLFGLCMLIVIINLFVGSWILFIPVVLILGYQMFRTMSHNRAARRRENDLFFGFFRKIGAFFKLQKNKFKDRKTHIYKKCPKCKAVLRLPKSKGAHTVCCPRCGERFNVKG